MSARSLFLAAALMVRPAQALPQATRVVLNQTSPGAYRLDGEFEVDADPQVAWDVITDYDGIGRFVSSIESSRILKREENGAVIEQTGVGSFLFISRRVKLTLDVKETPPGRVEFRKVYGPQFKNYAGAWTISAGAAGCVVKYELTAEPDPSIGPRFAAKRVLRSNVQRLLDEVRLEIIRRRRPNI